MRPQSTGNSRAQTDENAVGPGASIAHAPTDWLQSQIVGGNLDQLMSFATTRMQPRSGGDLMALLAGPGLSLNAPDNWAGPGGMGTPQGQGDWAAMVHDLPTGSSEAMYSPSPCGKERRSGRSIFAAENQQVTRWRPKRPERPVTRKS